MAPISIATQVKKSAGNLARSEVYARSLKLPLSETTVLYESFSGNGALCNPEAVFHYLTGNPKYRDLKHVWVLHPNTPDREQIVKDLKRRGNVQVVAYRSPRYWHALATSKYVLNNATFPWEFVKREGQVYVNLWHGTPLKKMGYDIEGGGPETRNIVRNFVAADFLVSANARTTDMYERAYKMRGIFRGKILETGYPRTDRQNLSPADERESRAVLARHGIKDDGRKLVVLAPTWKGDSFYSVSQDGEELLAKAQELEERLGASEYRVLLKVHQTLAQATAELPAAAGRLAPHELPTNVLLGLADALVTDYSSIFFDYLSTSRPIAFYVPDVDAYSGSRGIYDQPDDLPGPVSKTLQELASGLQSMFRGEDESSARWAAAREAAAAAFTPYEDGGSTERVVSAVFDGAVDVPGLKPAASDHRESVLLYLGGMASNGITTSALNLLRTIDHDRFDVSVFFGYSRQADKVKNVKLIDPRVRLFIRQGTVTSTFRETARYQSENLLGLPAKGRARHLSDEVWALEWKRCFGDAQFDYVVDFSGYSPFWSRILLAAPTGRKAVWLHNDLVSDSRRTVGGKQAHKANLESMFTLYQDFDSLVSVSQALRDLNRRHLVEYATPEKFVYAVNTIDAERILTAVRPLGETPLPGAPSSLEITSLRQVVRGLLDSFDRDDVQESIERSALLRKFDLDDDRGPVFVTVGRLSPEKNHERVISAFSQVHAAHPDARLVIVGGGPLQSALRTQAQSLGLAEAVKLVGLQPNPYIFVERADCFVLSSDYEGQPMVILEARVLHKPVVSTAFGSVRSAVPEGTGLIVDRSVDALAEGMQAYLEGRVPQKNFDPAAYNAVAMAEFSAAIGAFGNGVK